LVDNFRAYSRLEVQDQWWTMGVLSRNNVVIKEDVTNSTNAETTSFQQWRQLGRMEVECFERVYIATRVQSIWRGRCIVNLIGRQNFHTTWMAGVIFRNCACFFWWYKQRMDLHE